MEMYTQPVGLTAFVMSLSMPSATSATKPAAAGVAGRAHCILLAASAAATCRMAVRGEVQSRWPAGPVVLELGNLTVCIYEEHTGSVIRLLESLRYF